MNCYICGRKLNIKNVIHMAIYENYGGRIDYMCLGCYKKTKKLKKFLVEAEPS